MIVSRKDKHKAWRMPDNNVILNRLSGYSYQNTLSSNQVIYYHDVKSLWHNVYKLSNMDYITRTWFLNSKNFDRYKIL